jgi:monofunctional glycosyltransferase
MASLRVKKNELLERVLFIITSPYRAFRALCFAIGLCTLLVFAAVGLAAASFYASLPDLSRQDFDAVKVLATKKVKSRLEDKRKPVHWTAIKDVSRNFLYAIVMSEDAAYFEHEGIDVDAILDSLARNIKARKYEAGGSTISQQVVKNLYLGGEKSLVRKVKEALITDRLERRFGKNEILELYLNIAEFGPDIFGVSDAARHYFGKEPSQINPAEGAFIALMLPSPRKHHFTIFENRNLTKQHRRKIRRILGDMLANELISPRQYHELSRFDFSRELERRVAGE